NSIKTDAFKLTEFGTLGFMRDEEVYLLHTPYRPHTAKSEFSVLDLSDIPAVEIFHVHQSADPKLLQYMLDHYDGVVLAGTGSGNYPKSVQDVIENYDGPCAVVRSSRLLEGAVYPSEVFDPKNKTIPAFRISPHKARILLQLALSKTRDPRQLKDIFEKY
ncbi:MAG: L-asparaginase, partial [Erysipelotrichaceae bacterium]|nr:L-asparaginase [Erysipelotrichaceae bacterium]